MTKKNKLLYIAINNNISLRNWYYSDLINSLSKTYKITILTENLDIQKFFEERGVHTLKIQIPHRILKIINWYTNNTKSKSSSTKLIKNNKIYPWINHIISTFLVPVLKYLYSYPRCDLLILTSIFGGSNLMAYNLTNPVNLYGFVNSWDNPSSRNLLDLPYQKIFVWSEYVKNSLTKFSDFNEEKIEIIGRFQDQIPQNINEKTFRKIIGTDKKIIALIHGGGDFKDINKQFYHLLKLVQQNDYVLIFRGYGIYDYEFLNDKHKNLYISVPNAISIGNKDFIGGKFDISDFNFYRCILEYSDKVFTNGSTVLLDTLRFNKKANVILDFFENNDYILYCYFHLFHAVLNDVAQIINYNNFHSILEFETHNKSEHKINELNKFYNGTPNLDAFLYELNDILK